MSELLELAGQRCLVVAGEEVSVRSVRDMTNLVGDALGEGATVIVVPAGTLDQSFFELRSGFAGEVLQKAANYQMKLAIIGDVSIHTAASKAFHDLVVESAHSSSYFFLPDMDALEARLLER